MENKFKMDALVIYMNVVYKVWAAEQTGNGPISYKLFPLVSKTNPTVAINAEEKYLKKWDGTINPTS